MKSPSYEVGVEGGDEAGRDRERDARRSRCRVGDGEGLLAVLRLVGECLSEVLAALEDVSESSSGPATRQNS